jgi:hypothetical protein
MKNIRVPLDDETHSLLRATVAAENTTIADWLRSRIEVAVRLRPDPLSKHEVPLA